VRLRKTRKDSLALQRFGKPYKSWAGPKVKTCGLMSAGWQPMPRLSVNSRPNWSHSHVVMSIMRRFAIAILLIFGVGSSHARSLNIVVVGASNTAGWGVGAANAFPARLQTILKERGIDAKVTSAGVIGDTTGGMLRRIDTAVPDNTNIVILQPGTNDLRFFGSKQQRAANISAIVDRLRRRHIRVIVLDPVIPPDLLQWDGIHYIAAAHAKFAMSLAAQISGGQKREISQKKP
jgi:acyl-CoA thioesterase-1